ncbi:MAG: NTP transferase domain-containing protein [Candidatus Omnitrophica bacterium]|nr:NTP transferase domain-containing protein [Candidatus Omnitrophota bacterium]
MNILKSIDVVVLCGGKGERLQSVLGEKPKVLVEVSGRPFLSILIDNFRKFGFNRFILSVGYRRDKIIDYFKDRADIFFSQEEIALGTGGGLKKAESLVKSSSFLVVNGDSFCDLDFNRLFSFHREKRAILTMALVRTTKVKDYGTVTIDSTGKIKSFQEKVEGLNFCLANAGIYLMDKEIFKQMPQKKVFSLERDLFPKTENSFGFVTEAKLYDIGTPERYVQAKEFFNCKGAMS